MSVADQVTQASPLAAIFDRYHVGWETRNPDMIASLHSEDTIFWLHDASAHQPGSAWPSHARLAYGAAAQEVETCPIAGLGR